MRELVPGPKRSFPAPAKIVSGGQTGADRAALDWAMRHGIEHGGWCPKGRRAEDGTIPSRYALRETPSRAYIERTEWNVRDSDGTVLFTIEERLVGGALRTLEFAILHHKPHLHLTEAAKGNAALVLGTWMRQNSIRVLNAAGSRATREPRVGSFVRRVLDQAFAVRARRGPG
jgi:Circularly permutated YpsA SLOG family